MSGKNKEIDHKKDAIPQVIRATQSQVFSGPIPHPDILAGYEKVAPGAAERIIIMAETEQSHRHVIETNGQRGEINNERIGMVLAFFICLIAITGGVYCIAHGQTIPGSIATAIPLGIIVLAFLQGRRKK